MDLDRDSELMLLKIAKMRLTHPLNFWLVETIVNSLSP
jgi:hypothetical protein